MSEGTKVLNQNETPQDLKAVQGNIDGMLQTAAQNINQGKDPGVGGGDGFNMLAEMGMAKSGHAGFAAHLHEDIASGGVESSQFMFSRSSPGGKRGRKTEQLASMNDPLGLPKSYQQKKEDAQNLARLQSGRGPKSKDPFAQGSGGGGRDFFGNAVAQNDKPKYVTKEMLRTMPHLYGFGVQDLARNDGIAKHDDEHKAPGAIVAGVAKGHDNMREAAKHVETAVLDQAMQGMGSEVKASVKKEIKAPGLAPPKPPGMSDSHRKGDDKDRWN